MSRALVEHRAAVAATRDDWSCLRPGCDSPGAVRFFTDLIELKTACIEHGREVYGNLGGKRAEEKGCFAWWLKADVYPEVEVMT